MATSKTLPEKIDEHLDNGVAIYYWLIAAIAFTTPVNAEVGRIISRLIWANEGGKFIHGLIFAAIIEIGIFILAAIGESRAAKFIMYYSICAHILYFHMWDEFIDLHYGGYYVNNQFVKYTTGTLEYSLKLSLAIVKLLSSIGVSVVAPKLIFLFSEKIAERRMFKTLKATIEDLLKSFKAMLEHTKGELASIQQNIAGAKQELADCKQEIAELQQTKANEVKELAALKKERANHEEAKAEYFNELASLKEDIKTLKLRKNAMQPRGGKNNSETSTENNGEPLKIGGK